MSQHTPPLDLTDLTRSTIGEIAVSWSKLELYWFQLFKCLVPSIPNDVVATIYFHNETNKGQRTLLMAVADAVYPKDKNGHYPKLRKRIGQLNATTNELSGFRNAAIHAELVPVMRQIRRGDLLTNIHSFSVAPGANPKRKNRLSNANDLIEELRETARKIDDLIADLGCLLDDMTPKQGEHQEPLE